MANHWEQMAEDIRRALQAVERAHAQGEALKQDPSATALKAYQQEIRALLKELKALDYILHHEVETVIEDIGDVVHEMLTGEPFPYRHPHDLPETHAAEKAHD